MAGGEWDDFRRAMAGASLRSPAWREAGLWALDSLQRHLGARWLETEIGAHEHGLRRRLAYAPSHSQAFASTRELALRLEVAARTPGAARVRRALSTDPRAESVAHAELQLEVATLARRRACGLQLEPKAGRSRPPDLLFDVDGSELVVEAQVIFTSELWRDDQSRSEELFAWVREIEVGYGVTVLGHFSRFPNADEETSLRAAVEDRAALAGAGLIAPPLRQAGAELEVSADSRGRARGLEGPAMGREQLWERTRSKLAEKAAQARGSGATWLRVDIYDGLWQFTPWAQMHLREKLRMLRPLVEDAAVGFHGAAVSSGCLMRQGELPDAEAALDGAFALRRNVFGGRARELLVIPLRGVAAEEAEFWREIYADESGWVAQALAEVGLGSPEEILATDSGGVS